MIKTKNIGSHNGHTITEACLTASSGVEIYIMNYGGVVRDWLVPVQDDLRSVVLGFDGFDPYPAHSPHMGAIVGRVANRISNACFEMDGKAYFLDSDENGIHLHGGRDGLSTRVWEMQTDSVDNRVRLTCFSPAGESSGAAKGSGYPGNVKFEVTYQLKGDRLRLDLKAWPDAETPISLAQHNYFNLGTSDNVLDHRVQISGARYTKLDNRLLPTGEILAVEGSIYDFRTGRILRDEAEAPLDYDLSFVLDKTRDQSQPVARVDGPDEKLGLEIWTDRPGLQFYNGVTTNVKVPGRGGKSYGKYSGLCLEDQMFPDALNHAHFPSILCTPDRPYAHWCEIEIKQVIIGTGPQFQKPA